MPQSAFVHLHVHSAFSFRDGASRVEDLVSRVAELGCAALAVTDHDNVSAAVRFARAAREAGIKPIQGAEVTLAGGYHLVLLAQDPRGYANLCRLLARAHLGSPRGRPQCSLEDLEELAEGLVALSGCRRGEVPSLILHGRYEEARRAALRYRSIFADRFYLELQGTLLPGDGFLNRRLAELGRVCGIKLAAAADVHYATREDFPLHDLLTCARLGITLEEVHPERRLNDENYLKSPAEMAGLFSWCPEALANTLEIAERCRPALDLEEKRYPRFSPPEGRPAEAFLRELVYRGARERYPKLAPEVRQRLERELEVIFRLGYADYFLVVWDIARYARSRGIRCSGRGSAGASAVAYCLFLTEVDPISRSLAFERFLSLERAEKPDIDLDFDARRRDEVAEYVYRRYGEERVAAVAVYSTYQARSAVRDLGKALGFGEQEIDALAKTLPHVPADAVPEALERLPELRRGPWRDKKYRRLFQFCARLGGLPRFLGTHLGGLIVTDRPVTEVTPLQRAAKGVKIAQFDRDDVEELNLLKLDLLCLRALSVLEDAAAEISKSDPGFAYEKIPLDDKPTYRLLNRGRTVGVFQLESPAQRALQTRLLAENIEDVVASLALIRPGPIKGNMVDPFVARRRGLEPVTYLHPRLKPILEKTYGVVLFQEQVIAIASELAGFTPGEADRLRRLMTHARSHQEMRALGEEFVRRAVARGVPEKTAREIFACLEGYASYGFCEAHAAAFATTAYWTAYLSAHYPAEFFAAILNNQPMGYYPLDVVANEAKRRGVRFLPPDINASGDRFTIEGGMLRVPLSRVKGMGPAALEAVLREREKGPFRSLADFCRRVRPDRDLAENLVRCGAFDRLHPNRRALLSRLSQALAASSGQAVLEPDPPEDAEDFPPEEKRLMEYEVLGLEVEGHCMALWRPRLAREGYAAACELLRFRDGARAKVAGIPVRPHRPPTRSGRTVAFLSLEDETGLANITVFEDVYQKYGHLLFGPQVGPLRVAGTVARRGLGVSVVAHWIAPL